MADFLYSSQGESPWWCANRQNEIQTVVISNTVTNIGDRAFKDCQNLHTIEIPNSVIIIGIQAFNNCINLQTLVIPNSVNYIEGEAFRSSGLKNLTIANGSDALTLGSHDNYYSRYEDWFTDCPLQTLHLGRTISIYYG